MELLLGRLARAEKETHGNRQLIEHSIAHHFLFLVLGQDWHARNIAFCDRPDPWMLNGSDSWLKATKPAPRSASPRWWRSPGGVWLKTANSDVRRIIYCYRVIRLADALFTLFMAKTKGLNSLIERFLKRPTKACFLEAEIASLLVYNGFQVEIVKETGVRGDDFDLLASSDANKVSVEVTSKIEGPLTTRTIANTLQSKRDQVPDSRPAVLYISISPKWMHNEKRAYQIFTSAINRFGLRSRRFNAVVLTWEEVIPAFDGGFPTMMIRACYIHRARFPLPQADLFSPVPRNGKIRVARSLLETLENHREKIRRKATSELTDAAREPLP